MLAAKCRRIHIIHISSARRNQKEGSPPTVNNSYQVDISNNKIPPCSGKKNQALAKTNIVQLICYYPKYNLLNMTTEVRICDGHGSPPE